MITITYPTPAFKIKKQGGKDIIFDDCRKQWVQLTPEEWVRQNFLQYLIQVKKYPYSLIAVEREIVLGDLRKRFDIVVFKNAAPWMIVECKEMKVELSDAVIRQILNYNVALQVEYLVVTNGKSTFALYIQQGKFDWLTALPDF
ncbi:MAG: type I restriction enzyme HsdR N-terminal domain-containing protein [Bacteroidota bacterium]|nr:type I restriction enzyme HsdR N-terminal domain-containing protein [Bacteroidota bacterium]